jgi:AcrR family transcriptional regulator
VTDAQPRRRPYSRINAAGDTSRDSILTAALREFSTRGFRGASIGAIASAAGVSQSGLLHHFPSKTALLEAVIGRDLGGDAHVFESSQDGGLGFLDGLIRLVGRSRDEAHTMRLLLTLAAEAASPDHPAHEWAVARYRTTRGLVIAAIDEAQQNRVLRPDLSPADIATGLLAAMDGVQLQWLIDPTSVDPVAAFAAIVDATVASLVSDTPEGVAAKAGWDARR